MKAIGRKIPVRVAYVGIICSVYAFAVVAQAVTGVESTTLAQVVIGAIGVAIAGDTYRPSGMVTATAKGGKGESGGSGSDASGEGA